jgi:hypothetical protein
MDETPLPQQQAQRIPVIGRLTALELLCFVGVILMAAAGTTVIAGLWPELETISAPGSGGGAQMILAMFVLPAMFVAGLLAVGGCVGFALLLVAVRSRLERQSGRSAAPVAIDVRTLDQPLHALTASLAAEISCLLVPMILTNKSIALVFFSALLTSVAGLVFLVSLAMLASRLGKNPAWWLILTLLVFPFGPFIAYFLMYQAVKDARAGTDR